MRDTFENTEISLALKSDSELDRALFLFEIIKREPLVRIGALVTKFAINMGLPVEKLIRSTVFDHFCGGVSELDCLNIIQKMFSKNVYAVLDYSAERKEEDEQFHYSMTKTLNTLEYAKDNRAIPFVVFKPTGFGRFDIYQKIQKKISLNKYEAIEWISIKDRYHTVCSRAHAYGIPVLIDAEESWMQDAADNLIEEMMEIYNKEKAIVFGTIQAYRWDRLDYLKDLHEKSKIGNFKIGIKLVRGAYMEKERQRALKKGYEDPICKTKKATDELYNDILKYMIENLDHIAVFAGTHNEASSYMLMNLIEKKKLFKNDKRIWFGQLYGMSDHISFNLSELSYNVAKYLPFGPVRDVMPYLIRRAEENTSVAGQTSRELEIIRKEIKRRKEVKN